MIIHFDLTYAQLVTLRTVVRAAAAGERDRVLRMRARPPGTHNATTIHEAECLVRDLEALHAALAGVSA